MCKELEAIGLPDPVYNNNTFILKTTVLSASFEHESTQNARIRGTNASIEAKNARIGDKNASIEAKNVRIEDENVRIGAKNARIGDENARIETENARIETQNIWNRRELALADIKRVLR